MQALYRCYFLDRDGHGRSLARIAASDPQAAVEIALKRFPRLRHRPVDVFEGAVRVLRWAPGLRAAELGAAL